MRISSTTTCTLCTTGCFQQGNFPNIFIRFSDIGSFFDQKLPQAKIFLEHSVNLYISVVFQTTGEFLAAYDQLGVREARSAYTQVTYDTVWTVALTLKKTLKYWKQQKLDATLGQFTYDAENMTRTFFNVMGNLEFMGVSVSSQNTALLK